MQGVERTAHPKKEQMERLTIEQIKQFSNTTFGREIGKQLSRQVVDELLAYKQLEEEIGCPLEVRCKLYDGTIIYDEDGRKMLVQELGEHDFIAYPTKEPYTPCLMYIKGYKKSWWLKEDRRE